MTWRERLYVWRMTAWAYLTFGYVSPAGRHRHKCPECGAVWEHDDRPWFMIPPDYHDCPNGHRMAPPKFKYYGREAPQ
jgi:hypothetical protein